MFSRPRALGELLELPRHVVERHLGPLADGGRGALALQLLGGLGLHVARDAGVEAGMSGGGS